MADFASTAQSLVNRIINDFNAPLPGAVVALIEAELDSAYDAGRKAGKEEAEEEYEDRLASAAVLSRDVHDACIAADEGVPGAGRWAASRVREVVPDASERTARMLARRRPRDFYAHG